MSVSDPKKSPAPPAAASSAGDPTTVNVHEAKTHLSRILKQVEAGQEFVVARSGKPVAKIVPLEPQRPKPPVFGSLAGKLWIAEDFDAPLPDEIVDSFYE